MVRQGLENLSAELPLIGRRRIRTVMNRVVRRMQAYPAQRSGQRYVRTGRLFSHWKIEEIERGYSVENTAAGPNGKAYAKYVVGDAYGTGQAWMHAGRWDVFRDVMEEELQVLPDEIHDEIILVARRVGL
jgi:hypothetical protein